MSKDENAAKKAMKVYYQAIEEFKLDDIPEYQNNRREYMKASFFSGFYSGRNYLQLRVDELEQQLTLTQREIHFYKYGPIYEPRVEGYQIQKNSDKIYTENMRKYYVGE